MKKRMLKIWCMRYCPITILIVLILVTFGLYSLHDTDPNDPRDLVLSGLVFVCTLANVLYLVWRTKVWRVQFLGIIAFILADTVFYGTIFLGRLGVGISAEIQFDLLRACVTVAMIVYPIGILLFERSLRREHDEKLPDGKDVGLYQDPEIRADPLGRGPTGDG